MDQRIEDDYYLISVGPYNQIIIQTLSLEQEYFQKQRVVQFRSCGMNPLHVQFFYRSLYNFRPLNPMLSCFHMLLLLWYKALCVVRSRKSISFSYLRVFYVMLVEVAVFAFYIVVDIIIGVYSYLSKQDVENLGTKRDISGLLIITRSHRCRYPTLGRY